MGENANRFSVSVERGTPERWGFNVSFVRFLTCGIQAGLICMMQKAGNDSHYQLFLFRDASLLIIAFRAFCCTFATAYDILNKRRG